MTGIKISPLDPQHIYVSTSSGKLVRMNWEANTRAGKWTHLGEAVCGDIVPFDTQGKEYIAYFAAIKRGSAQCAITVNTISPSQQADIPTKTVVLEKTKFVHQMQVLQNGHVIVACAGQHAVIGTLNEKQHKNSPFSEYVWREVRLPVSRVTSFDAREAGSSVDLAIGEASGAILLYQDILNVQNRGDIAKNGLPLLQRLHWHREAVSSVRWSKDGKLLHFQMHLE